MVALLLLSGCDAPERTVDAEWLEAYRAYNEEVLTAFGHLDALGPARQITHFVDPGESGDGVAVSTSAVFDVAPDADAEKLAEELRSIGWTACLTPTRLLFDRDRGRGSASITTAASGGRLARVSVDEGRLLRGHPGPRRCEGM